MEFKNQPPDWLKEGVEPPEELKTKGWLAGYKPPASFFNWFWNKCYLCLKELQEKLSSLATSHNEDVETINTELGKKAPLASPTFTGVPKAPTAVAGTDTTQVATTEFVNDAIDSAIGDIDFSAFQEHTKYVTNANLNTLLEDGNYISAGTMTNTPISTTYCFVTVLDTGSTNRIVQKCYVPQSDNSCRTFVRIVNGTAFGAWIEFATKGYVDEAISNIKVPVTSVNGATGDVVINDYIVGITASDDTITYTFKDGRTGITKITDNGVSASEVTTMMRSYATSLSPARMTKYEDIAAGTKTYTCPIDGFLRVKIGAIYSCYIYINGIEVFDGSRTDDDSGIYLWSMIPVKKGDVMTWTVSSGQFKGGAMWYPY